MFENILYLYTIEITNKKIEIMETIITNESLYHGTVVCVDATNVKNVTNKSFYANVEIVTLFDKNPVREFQGEFGYNDFEAEFGFKFSK